MPSAFTTFTTTTITCTCLFFVFFHYYELEHIITVSIIASVVSKIKNISIEQVLLGWHHVSHNAPGACKGAAGAGASELATAAARQLW